MQFIRFLVRRITGSSIATTMGTSKLRTDVGGDAGLSGIPDREAL